MKNWNQAECSFALPAGAYKATIYAYAKNADSDAIYLYIAGFHYRSYPRKQKSLEPCVSTLAFTVKGKEPVLMIVMPGEPGVTVDRIEIMPVKQ